MAGERVGSRHCADLVYRLRVADPDDRVLRQRSADGARGGSGSAARPRRLVMADASARHSRRISGAGALPVSLAAELDLPGELGTAAFGRGRLRRRRGDYHGAARLAARPGAGAAARGCRRGRLREFRLGRRHRLCRGGGPDRHCLAGWRRGWPRPRLAVARGGDRGRSRGADCGAVVARRISRDDVETPDRAAAVCGAGPLRARRSFAGPSTFRPIG